jgi:chemotaxis protein MotB
MSVRRRRGAHGGGHGSSERWLLTYADLITLLLAFFIILYAMSVTDHKKVYDLSQALKSAFHVTQGAESSVLSGQPSVLIGGATPMDFVVLQDQLEREIAKAMADDPDAVGAGHQGQDGQQAVTTKISERGLVVSLASSAFFSPGDATLRPETQALMRTVAGALKRSGRSIMVEGHTDDLPINTARFPSNWELSTGRATTVVRYLIEAWKLPPERLSAAGYGEYKPLVANTSAANRAKNRRVDIVILRTETRGERPAGQL